MQQGIKKLQWFEYLKGVFLEILNALLCRVFANQVTYEKCGTKCCNVVHRQSVDLFFAHRHVIDCAPAQIINFMVILAD